MLNRRVRQGFSTFSQDGGSSALAASCLMLLIGNAAARPGCLAPADHASAPACKRASCTPSRTAATRPTRSCSTAPGSTSAARSTGTIKFMFNTEYNGAGNDVDVLDAVAQFEFSDKFNIWVGRFLPPSDRANLYGPYYSHHWAVYTDGVQDGYPFIFQGRDNGAMYWGQFGKVKVSAGAFDGASATGDDTLLGAGRVQVDFWDPETGYYLNGTYYGDKNLLAIGARRPGAGRATSRPTTSTSCSSARSARGGAVSVEAEWAKYDRLGGYNARYGTDDGGYVLGAYLFPQLVGDGPVRGARQVRAGAVPRGHHAARSSTTTRRPPSSTSTTSSSSSTRA